MHRNRWLPLALAGCADPGGQTLVYELDCETITTPIAAAALPSDVDVDAIAALGGTRSGAGAWEDGPSETVTVEATVASDGWQVVAFEGTECPENVSEVYSGHADVALTSTSGRLSAAWSNEIGAGLGAWALGSALDEEASAGVLTALGRDPDGAVTVSLLWGDDGETLSGTVDTLEEPSGASDVTVTLLAFGP